MVRSEESYRGHHVGLRGARRLRDHRTVRLWQVDVDPLPESDARDDSEGEGRREGPPQRGGHLHAARGDRPPPDRNVFQKANPFPTMSIYENVAAGLRLNGERNRDRLDTAVLESLKQAALWDEVKDSLEKSGASLSGGQQQRLCIARALAVRPEVLLMDEPCAALDPIATAKIEDLIFDLKQDYTVVIVTHNMQQAARVAETTAFMYLGHLIEVGATRELFERPKETLTESYITGRFG